MLILGIDTTTKTASTAVVDFDNTNENANAKILAEIQSCGKLSHSENLMPIVDYTLKSAGLTLDDIDLFAVAHGPGSFTGIRIAISTVKGLAFGSEINNCAGISSLCSLAYNFHGTFDDTLIFPVIDARRKQVYNAVFDNTDGLKYIKTDRIITVSELEEELNREFSGRKIIFTGDGAEMCFNEIKFDGEIINLPEILKKPSAASVCKAAYYEKYKKNETIHPKILVPVYLIKTQAEREYSNK